MKIKNGDSEKSSKESTPANIGNQQPNNLPAKIGKGSNGMPLQNFMNILESNNGKKDKA